MNRLSLRLGILFCLALSASCTPTATGSNEIPATQAPSAHPTVLSKPFDTTANFPDITSISLTSAGDSVYMIVGREQSLYVSHSSDGARTFTEPVTATGNQTAHVLRVERPAISANEEGKVGVAWLELSFEGGKNKVWYAQSVDRGQTFEAARLVSEEIPGETAMVQILLDSAGNPILTWLSGNDLRFARSVDGGESFSPAKEIGKGACECCQPAMLRNRNELLVAYRGMSLDQDGSFRDAALIKSADGGATFGPVSFATDSHWYIDACPISGPSIAARGDAIYMTWMDGRAVAPDNLLSSDVWFAASTDSGQTFSANVQVSGGESTHNALPVMAVGPGGRIHLAWQAIKTDALYYAISDDGGKTFSAALVIADDRFGRPTVPTMAIDSKARIHLAWLDDSGAHLVAWHDPN